MERMQLYCLAHPDSPSAMHRPQLSVRGELWIALLGPSVEDGIVGIGPTVEGALQAFECFGFNHDAATPVAKTQTVSVANAERFQIHAVDEYARFSFASNA